MNKPPGRGFHIESIGATQVDNLIKHWPDEDGPGGAEVPCTANPAEDWADYGWCCAECALEAHSWCAQCREAAAPDGAA